MCGIIGMIGVKGHIGKGLLTCIKKLEYRGYDSLGMATMDNNSIDMRKDVGNVDTVNSKVNFEEMEGFLGICHTRWATQGSITRENAHPHFNKEQTIFAVHNGIIENYEELKKFLEEKGYSFETKTDSEIIPFYFDYKLKQGLTIKETIIQFLKEVTGSFAILLILKGQKKIWAIKKDSPLVLGRGDDFNIIASDIYAFNNLSNKAIFFEDNEFAVIEDKNVLFYNLEGQEIKKEVKLLDSSREEENKKNFPHFMIKEIKEQPLCAKRVIDSFETSQQNQLKKFIELIKSKKKVAFISCGTSYHASLIGVSLLKQIGISAQSIVASEWDHFIEADEDTFVIAISQSGETMDVVISLKEAKKKGASIGSIVNVPHSTIQRLSDVTLNILAGQEVAVASTKTFTNTNIVLLEIARLLGLNFDLNVIQERLSKTLELREKCKEIARELKDKKDVYILGRHFSYPIAREIALKLKEVDYVHAEGMMAGELKHGTLALIEKDIPVFCLVPKEDKKISSSIEEVKTRGAKVYLIGDTENSDIKIPSCDSIDFPIYATLIGHLLSYELGVLKGLEIDQCRNLAKSVTVI